MIDCQVRWCTEVCRCVVSVRRQHGGTVADQVAWWRNKWHGGAPGGTVVRWFHGGAPDGTVVSQCLTKWRTRSHSNTVAACVWQVARLDCVPGGKV